MDLSKPEGEFSSDYSLQKYVPMLRKLFESQRTILDYTDKHTAEYKGKSYPVVTYAMGTSLEDLPSCMLVFLQAILDTSITLPIIIRQRIELTYDSCTNRVYICTRFAIVK